MQKQSGGKRHTNGLGGPGELAAHIEESRIYSVPLTEDEVNEMEIGTLSVDPQRQARYTAGGNSNRKVIPYIVGQGPRTFALLSFSVCRHCLPRNLTFVRKM